MYFWLHSEFGIAEKKFRYKQETAIADLLSHSNLRNTSEIYHFTNSGVASWYDFAVAIFEEAQTLGFPIKVNQVVPITTSDYPTPAKRPAYSVLSGQKITSILGNYPPYWRDSLKQMLKQYVSLPTFISP